MLLIFRNLLVCISCLYFSCVARGLLLIVMTLASQLAFVVCLGDVYVYESTRHLNYIYLYLDFALYASLTLYPKP